MVPSFELKTQISNLKAEMMAALERVVDSGHFILGPEVAAFEKEFLGWNESQFGCSCGSGTEALHLALRAFEVKPGDEVICPAFTYMASASAISLCGATPVFVDVDPDSFTLNCDQFEKAITPKTRAVVAVHLYGHPADMERLCAIARRHNLAVIEDCAQSTGARYQGTRVGNFGDYGCFSFFPTKNLGAFGDGGYVTAKTAELADRIRSLRAQGQGGVKYFHERLGTNSRLDEMQAAVLRVKLPHVDDWNRRRRAIAARYLAGLTPTAEVKLPVEKAGCEHVYHQFTVVFKNRAARAEHLKSLGINTTVYYPCSIHLQKAYAHLGYQPGSLPVSEALQDEALSLPMFPELETEAVDQVIAAVNARTPSYSTQP